jgi:hypothetical protein
LASSSGGISRVEQKILKAWPRKEAAMGRHLLLNGWPPLFAVLALYEGFEGRLSWMWAIVVCALAAAVVLKSARITVLEAQNAQSRPANAEQSRLPQGARDRDVS